MAHKSFYFILFFLSVTLITAHGQSKQDTMRFILHYPENKIEADENLLEQVDSVLNKVGFSDLEYETKITNLIIYGHSDSKGSKRSNQLLSSKRAEAIGEYLQGKYNFYGAIILGFGDSKPVGKNKTEEGRAQNRRVEITIVYKQTKIPGAPNSQLPKADTIIEYPDGTKLKMNLLDYNKIGSCLTYQKQNKLIDIFEDLVIDQSEDAYFIFGKVTVHWCTAECLGHPLVLSIHVQDSIVKTNQRDIRNFLKRIKQPAKLQKHKDNLWYIDVSTRCPLDLKACSIHCATRGGGGRPRFKRVKYIAKDGYKIVAVSVSDGAYWNCKKIRTPKRCIKSKVVCPYNLPEVSIVAVKDNKFDTLYFASGTEQVIEYKRRCFNCVDKNVVVRTVIGIPIHRRLLRQKYIFYSGDYLKSFKVLEQTKNRK